jgi:hypothetical protein
LVLFVFAGLLERDERAFPFEEALFLSCGWGKKWTLFPRDCKTVVVVVVLLLLLLLLLGRTSSSTFKDECDDERRVSFSSI